MLGLTNIAPKFVKKYKDINKNIKDAVKMYSREVKNRSFPSSEYTYRMLPQIVNSNSKK